MASKMMVVDGGMLEGGGQILRNAAALSCLQQKPVFINNIRAGRSKPGLRPQHLSGLTLLASLSQGRLEGGQVGSTEITLTPGAVHAGEHIADTKTAGSVCLMIQAALPCMLFGDGPVHLVLKGGTNAAMAPPIDYFQRVFQPMVSKFVGIEYECNTVRRGFFPKGGGEVRVSTQPIKTIQAIDITQRGDILRVTGQAFVAGRLPIGAAHGMAREAQKIISHHYRDVPINIDVQKIPDHQAIGNGCAIIVVAETSTGCLLAGSGLAERGERSEVVGQKAGQMLVENLQHGGCVDEYLQDQLIILMALAQGKSKIRSGPISLHTQTAIEVAQMITGVTFSVNEVDSNTNVIECDGIGLTNQHMS